MSLRTRFRDWLMAPTAAERLQAELTQKQTDESAARKRLLDMAAGALEGNKTVAAWTWKVRAVQPGERVPCGGKRRSDGKPCEALSEPGKRRCKWHGGCSTGPRTAKGKARSTANLGDHLKSPKVAKTAGQTPIPRALTMTGLATCEAMDAAWQRYRESGDNAEVLSLWTTCWRCTAYSNRKLTVADANDTSRCPHALTGADSSGSGRPDTCSRSPECQQPASSTEDLAANAQSPERHEGDRR